MQPKIGAMSRMLPTKTSHVETCTTSGVAVSWAKAQDIYNGVLRRGMESGLFYPGEPSETAILVQSIMQMQMARAVELGREDPAEVAEAMMVHIRRLLCLP